MNCEWCCRELDGKSRDHVFSRLLGGQLADGLWVPACTVCSKVISKAEDEVAHRSHISLFRLPVGLQPRHPKRSSSGVVEPKISLVKDPASGRYSVFAVRVGNQHPEILPALEVDFNNGQIFFHGAESASCTTLIAEICKFFDSPPRLSGLVGELSAPRLEELNKTILSDPDYNPRIYLSPRGRLEVCSRTAEECIKLMQFVGYLSKRDEFRNFKSKSWASWSIPGRTPHHTTFVYDRRMFDQVILKIALGLIGAHLRRSNALPWHCSLHDMVRGVADLPEGLIKYILAHDFETKGFSNQLIALAMPIRNRLIAFVGIFGEFYSAEFEGKFKPPILKTPVGAACHVVSPRLQRWFDHTEAHDYAEALSNG